MRMSEKQRMRGRNEAKERLPNLPVRRADIMAAAYIATFVQNSELCFSRLSSLIFIVLYLRKG